MTKLPSLYDKVPGSGSKNKKSSNKNKGIISNNSNNNNKKSDNNNNNNSRKPISGNTSSSKMFTILWDAFDDHLLFDFQDIYKTVKSLLATEINILRALSMFYGLLRVI